jgi:hypothetical protein
MLYFPYYDRILIKVAFCFPALQILIYNDHIFPGGPTFFFRRANNSFPVGPKGQETPPGTIFSKLIANFRYI